MKDKIIEAVGGIILIASLWLIISDKPTTWQFGSLVLGLIVLGYSGYRKYKSR